MRLLGHIQAVFLATISSTTLAGPPKDFIHDGMLSPASPKNGKWIGKKTAEMGSVNGEGIITGESKNLGDCPLEIQTVNMMPLYKTDDSGKPSLDANGKLISNGWVTQKPYARQPRYFRRRLDKNGAPLLEPGGKVEEFEFSKDELLSEYFSLSIVVDHMGRGRTKDVAPKWPITLIPTKENLVLSRYDQDDQRRIAMVPYYVQENLIGLQGELVTMDGDKKIKTGDGVPEKPFFKVELRLDPDTQEPVYLDYTAGIVTGKNHNDWYFADTFNYECRDFKKVAK